MKKIFLGLMVLTVMVVLTSGCADKNQSQETNYYNSSSVFFYYPDTWNVARSIDVAGAEAVIVTDPTASRYINESSTIEELESLNVTDGTVFIYIKIPKTSEVNLNSTVSDVLQRLTQKGAKVTKNTTTNFSGIVANETFLTRTSEGVTSEGKVISFERNESVYALILITAGNSYHSQKKNFDLILTSWRFN
jgi:hypothetical protein